MARPSRKLCAILSADVVGYSRLMQSDEAATVGLLKEYRTAIGRIVERHKGRVVNAPGDALLAEFPSAVEAVEAAVEIQHCVAGRNLEIAPERRMQFRIGANLGDVIEETDGTLYGDGVNIAARMESLAEAGGICVSGAVHEAVDSKIDVQFESLGPQQVKNISKPIDVYKVRAADARRASPQRARRTRRWTLAATGGAAVAVAAALVVLISVLRSSGEQVPASAAPEPAANVVPPGTATASGTVSSQRTEVLPGSVAVLPFENLSAGR